jgi:hypothetical protein
MQEDGTGACRLRLMHARQNRPQLYATAGPSALTSRSDHDNLKLALPTVAREFSWESMPDIATEPLDTYAMPPSTSSAHGSVEKTIFWHPGICDVCTGLELTHACWVSSTLLDIKYSALMTRCRGCEVLWLAVKPFVHRAEAGDEKTLSVMARHYFPDESKLICSLKTRGHYSLADVEISTPTGMWQSPGNIYDGLWHHEADHDSLSVPICRPLQDA